MGVIEDIYKNSMRMSEQRMRKDKMYMKAKNQIKQHYEFLCGNISKREMPALDKMMSSYDVTTERKNIYCFKMGFKAGLAAASEELE